MNLSIIYGLGNFWATFIITNNYHMLLSFDVGLVKL